MTSDYVDNWDDLPFLKKYQPGGLCFFNPTAKGTPEKQVELTNRYQAIATNKLPMFITIDGEWGLGMRMKGTAMSFPRQLMLGAIEDNTLIYVLVHESQCAADRCTAYFGSPAAR